MVKIGSKNNPTYSVSLLTTAQQFYNAAELRSKDRRQYGELLTQVADLISEALKNKDINQLFELEKDA